MQNFKEILANVQKSKYGAAERYIESNTPKNQQQRDLMYLLALNLLKKNQQHLGHAALQKILSWDKHDLEALLHFSNILLAWQHNAKIVQLLEPVVSRSPRTHQLVSKLASAYIQLTQLSNAVVQLTQLTVHHPDVANYFALLGVTYQKLKQSNNAIKAYQQALSLDSYHINSYIHLSELLYTDFKPQALAMSAMGCRRETSTWAR